MARRFLAALALAHSATALIEGPVDVLVKVDIQIPRDAFADLRAAAAADDGSDACRAADDVLMECARAGHLDATTLSNDAVACICCAATTPISAVYSSCASYAAEEGVRTAYSIASQVYRACAAQADCRTVTSARASPTGTPADATVPAECSPMLDVYNSCVDGVDFQTVRNRDLASCLCHDQSGNFETEFQDLAGSCAPAARTELPRDYPVIARFMTICEDFSPTNTVNTGALVFTTAGSRTTDELFPAKTSAASIPTGDAADDTDGADNTGGTESTSTSTGLAAPGAALPGLLTWSANLATAVLSFLFLI